MTSHFFAEVRKKNMLALKDAIKIIESDEDYEKKLNRLVLSFALDRGLKEKTVWKYYNQLRKAGMVK